jgi:hypothetical protein
MNDRFPPPLRIGSGRKRNLFAHVVEDPDEPFPKEADLEREYQVSRSVIREAVKTLAAKGLLESKTRTGIRALPAMHWNLLDAEVLSWRYNTMPPVQFFAELFEIRLMIEPEAAALAAERATRDDLREIETAFQEMVEAAPAERDARLHERPYPQQLNPVVRPRNQHVRAGGSVMPPAKPGSPRQRSTLWGKMTRSRIVTFLGRVSMNMTASATSFGSIRLPDASASSIFSCGQSLSRAVTTGPGATAPTRIPCLATCRLTVWTKACTACLEAV